MISSRPTIAAMVALACATGPATVYAATGGGIGVGDDSTTGSVGTGPTNSSGAQKGENSADRDPERGSMLRGTAPILRRMEIVSGNALLRWVIVDRDRQVRVSARILKAADGQLVAKRSLGLRKTGILQSYRISQDGLSPGRYTVVLSARDRVGHRLRHPHIARAATFQIADHYFPIEGSWYWSGPGGEFGSSRSDHIHQGYDIIAAQGAHAVAPAAGTVSYSDFQAGGAGYYLVLDASDGYDYAFMHLREGSLRVRKGDPVRSGQWIAEVGSTGASSGPHLHFEIWEGPWQTGGRPIDPKPQLKSWAGVAGVEANALTDEPVLSPSNS